MKTILINTQKGFTIIELLVASLLALILLGSTTVMFVTNKSNSKLQDELGRLQENARFAMDLITQDLRMGDYVGCHENPSQVFNQINTAGRTILNFNDTLDGAEGSATTVVWEASGDSDIISNMSTNATATANPDAITIRYIQPLGVQTTSDIGQTGNLSIPAGSDLPSGTLLAISDCVSADLFQNTNATTLASGTISHGAGTGTPGNSNASFNRPYDSGSEISTLIARRYYIRASGSGTGTSLWWEDANANGSQELVEGVQNMQILYGEDTDADDVINGFFTADNVTTWTNVKAVKVGLLMETVNNIGVDIDANSYNLLGTTIPAANDRRKRKIFTSTIAIRNRM